MPWHDWAFFWQSCVFVKVKHCRAVRLHCGFTETLMQRSNDYPKPSPPPAWSRLITAKGNSRKLTCIFSKQISLISQTKKKILLSHPIILHTASVAENRGYVYILVFLLFPISLLCFFQLHTTKLHTIGTHYAMLFLSCQMWAAVILYYSVWHLSSQHN